MTPRARSPLERLPQAIAEQVVRRIVELLDVDDIARRIDVDDVVRRIDVNALMERVDVDEVVRRVDVDAVVARVDPDELLDRVDIDRIAARIDVNAIADRIDIDELVRRADLGPLIAQSTTGMLGEFLVLLRRQVVTMDDLVDAATLRSRREVGPRGPMSLLDAATTLRRPNREGQFAGAVTRLLALAVDVAAGWGIFTLLAFGINAAVGLFTAGSYSLLHHRVAGIAAAVAWGFLYFSVGWALTGRSIGMAVLGARVVTPEGRHPGGRSAVIRTLVLPVSAVVFFVGLFRSDRRALHDLCANTCVVYNWEARGDALPWRHAMEDSGVS